MGTDIHAAIEYRDAQGWHAYVFANKNFGKYEDEPMLTAKLDIARDYDLFAILAGVRNGKGFAGCKLGDGVEPISEPRGLPGDATPETLDVLSNEHSATWVSLAEILSYDWTRSSNKYGVVSSREFEKWDRMKEWVPGPKSFSGDVFGGKATKISEAQMRQYVSSVVRSKAEHSIAIAELDSHLYTQITWVESYAEMGKQLWTAILPIMLKLATEHGLANVRMVMDFDS